MSVRIAEEPGRTELSFPTALREEASSGTDEQQQTDQTAINDERPGRELFQDAKQPPDREKSRDRPRGKTDREHGPAMGIEVDLVEFPKFLASGERDGWQAQQERRSGQPPHA